MQLTDHGKPVIPGSSFAGAIRHRIKEILERLAENGTELPYNVQKIIDISFGYVDGVKACASNIIISEAEIKGARPLTMMRTGVSRFESAVKDGALYKEKHTWMVNWYFGLLFVKALCQKMKNGFLEYCFWH